MKKTVNNLLRRVINFFGSMRLALGGILTIGLSFALLSLFFFAWLADEMLEGDTVRFDEGIRNFIHDFSNPFLTAIMQAASFIGSTLFLFILGTIVFIIFYRLKRHRAAVIFALTTLGAGLLLVSLKYAFKRTRPEPFFETILPASYSFPSGHSLGSFCFYLALAAIIAPRVNNRLIKTLIWLSAVLIVLLIGISRIYLGVHYPSDVIAGYAVGLIWVITIAVGDRLMHVRDKSVLEKEKAESK